MPAKKPTTRPRSSLKANPKLKPAAKSGSGQTAKKKPAKEPIPFFDIGQPGLKPSSAVSRSVIVTKRAIMHDSSVLAEQPEISGISVKEPVDISPARVSPKIVIQPPADLDSRQPEPVRSKKPVPMPEATSSKPEAEPAAASPLQAYSAGAMVNEPKLIDASPDPDAVAAKLEAEAKAQDELDTLVEEKTYFLPINAGVQRRSRHVFIFGSILILVLAALWLDVSMDAGFVSISGLRPPTHIFRN